ncbi:MAG: hypothetical protein IJX14_02590 [Clostridia bacterium]|nr:hypothetical protein [Clostridia bacterium]
MKRIITSIVLAAVLAISTMAADVPYTVFYKATDLALEGSAFAATTADGTVNDKVLICNESGENASGTGATFTFTVPEDGAYTIWGRVYYPSQSNNSIHYSVDGGDSLIWDFPDEDDTPGETDPSKMPACYGSWQYFYLTYRQDGTFTDTNMQGWWSIENNQWRHAPNVLNLTAGEHSIHFVGRETGWMIDELVVTELTTEEYDPNYYEGNSAILDPCQFCGTYWQHYYEDIYAATGVSAEEYYNNTLYPVVEEAEVVDAAAAADAPVTAPQTADMTVLLAAAAALTGAIVSRKRR